MSPGPVAASRGQMRRRMAAWPATKMSRETSKDWLSPEPPETGKRNHHCIHIYQRQNDPSGFKRCAEIETCIWIDYILSNSDRPEAHEIVTAMKR